MIDNIGVVIFLLVYMGILWTALAFYAREPFARAKGKSTRWIYRGFFLLALGDTFHVGSRAIVYFLGINAVSLANFYSDPFAIQLLGIGLIATSITIHLFYLLAYFYWRGGEMRSLVSLPEADQFAGLRRVKILDIVATAVTVARLALIALPENLWGTPIDVPNVTRYITNVPFYILGVLVIALFLEQAFGSPREREMRRHIAYWMILSFAMYSLTVFFTWISPLFGIAMLPKTLAYLGILYSYVRGCERVANQKQPAPSARLDTDGEVTPATKAL